MKKLLLVLAIGVFAACNDGATADNTTGSLENKIDSTTNAKIDSIQNRADFLSNKIDSSADAKTEALKRNAVKK